MSQFQKDLEDLINVYSQETASGTPDYVLAEFLMNCLASFNLAVQERARWYNKTVNENITPVSGNLETEQVIQEARMLLTWLGMNHKGDQPTVPVELWQKEELRGRCLALRKALENVERTN